MENYSRLKVLGKGSFGQVWLVVPKEDPSKRLALKRVRLDVLKDKEKDGVLNEIRLLASIDSPFVVTYFTAFYEIRNCCLCIVMEFAEGGDLAQMLKKRLATRQYLNEDFILRVAVDVLRGLRTLHQHGILHRDIKPANIFFSKGGAKIGDLNISKVLEGSYATTQTGTPFYTAPQIWEQKPYDSRCDVWSFGCVLYEMAALTPPFSAANYPDLLRLVSRGNYAPLPSHFSSSLKSLIRSCLNVDQQLRPSCESLLQTPFLRTLSTQSPSDVHLLQPIECPRHLQLLNARLPKTHSKISSTIYERTPSCHGASKTDCFPTQVPQLHRLLSPPERFLSPPQPNHPSPCKKEFAHSNQKGQTRKPLLSPNRRDFVPNQKRMASDRQNKQSKDTMNRKSVLQFRKGK